ncbi:MAG: PASTA domain-containing protein [Bacteroidaceae bacterium]|nr:PASTA domain-containing protein [Bacteroidaceae bacterium]
MKEFLKDFFSKKVAMNFLAAILLLIAIIAGAFFALNPYTHHGEKIKVPNVKKKTIKAAKKELMKQGLIIQVSDTLYLKNLPADIVLEQIPSPGRVVKPGRIIYVVINAGHSAIKTLPDVIDNSSAREAKAILQAAGFKRIDIQYIAGEKEWLYGIKINNKNAKTGDKVSVEARLVLLVGDGKRDLGDSVTYIPSPYYYMEEDLYNNNTTRSNSGQSSSNSENTVTYTEEEVQNEVQRNLDSEIEQLVREKQQKSVQSNPDGEPQ